MGVNHDLWRRTRRLKKRLIRRPEVTSDPEPENEAPAGDPSAE